MNNPKRNTSTPALMEENVITKKRVNKSTENLNLKPKKIMTAQETQMNEKLKNAIASIMKLSKMEMLKINFDEKLEEPSIEVNEELGQIVFNMNTNQIEIDAEMMKQLLQLFSGIIEVAAVMMIAVELEKQKQAKQYEEIFAFRSKFKRAA
jgi:hypothetical protein